MGNLKLDSYTTIESLSRLIPSVYAIEDMNGTVIKINDICYVEGNEDWLYRDFSIWDDGPKGFVLIVYLRNNPKRISIEIANQGEAQNTYEIIKWLLKQGWCDG